MADYENEVVYIDGEAVNLTDIDDLDERLIATRYAVGMLRYEYLIFILLMGMMLFVAKIVYSIPFFIARKRRGGEGDDVTGAQLLGTMHANMDQMYALAGGLDSHLTKHDNKAVAVAFSGYYIGLGFIMEGVFQDFDDDPLQAVVYVVIFAAIGYFFLIISQFVNDRVILFRYRNSDQIKSANLSYGIVEGSGYIASGMVIGASLSGETHGWGEDFASTGIFFLLGQFLLVVWGFIYQIITTYDDQKEVGRGNAAAGVNFGLNLIAMGLLLANPVSKSDSIVAFVLWFALGTLAMVLMRFLIDLVILRGQKLDKEIAEDSNWGAALIQGSISITFVQIINTFMRDENCVDPFAALGVGSGSA